MALQEQQKSYTILLTKHYSLKKQNRNWKDSIKVRKVNWALSTL